MGTGLIFQVFYYFLSTADAATSCKSGIVNELGAFKNLFHLVCPYFTDHARIPNKSSKPYDEFEFIS